MYERICVAVDASNGAQQALHEALNLAKDQEAEVRLVHVLDYAALFRYPSPGFDFGPLLEAWRTSGEQILEQAAAEARQQGIEAQTSLPDSGDKRIAEVLVDETKEWPADLIVMGTHGRHGFEHLLLGSVAEGVIRLAPVPVLLIRSGTHRS
jgi:nucleotide-binding universal stress UspA family protein